jgi:hypothetical chaperone protein
MKRTYGLDFGASNSTISIVDQTGQAVKLPIDPFGVDKTISPTILYYVGNEIFCGSQADSLFKSTPVQDRGRIMREIKVCATITDVSGTMIDGRYKEFDDILGDYLRFAKTNADQLLGEKVGRVVIGRPAAYIDEPKKEKLAQDRIRRGAEKAGFDSVHFAYEPVAATLDRIGLFNKEEIILTFDFGGSTLDYHLLKIGQDHRAQTLAHGGIDFGGNDITRLVFETKVLSHFGAGLEYELKETDKMSYKYRNQKEYRAVPAVLPRILLKYDSTMTAKMIEDAVQVIRGIEWESHQTFEVLNRLETCLRKNLIYPLFDSVERTKIQLSDEPVSRVQFDKEGITFEEPVTRIEFEKNLDHYQARLIQSLKELLAKAGLQPEAVQGLLTIGGSSKIPYYNQFLLSFFPNAQMVQGDLFGGVSKGLAKIGHEDASEYYIDL